MEKDLIKIAREEGFKDIDDFVKANFHYLSKEEQKLFYAIDKIVKLNNIRKNEKKLL